MKKTPQPTADNRERVNINQITRQIANELGTSLPTVNRALNGFFVENSPLTRAIRRRALLVLAAMQRPIPENAEYKPERSLRATSRQKSNKANS